MLMIKLLVDGRNRIIRYKVSKIKGQMRLHSTSADKEQKLLLVLDMIVN